MCIRDSLCTRRAHRARAARRDRECDPGSDNPVAPGRHPHPRGHQDPRRGRAGALVVAAVQPEGRARAVPEARRVRGRARAQGEAAVRYEPLYDRILVRLLKPDERTKAGLFVPQIAADNTPYLKAEVLAVGQGRITTTGNVV